MPTNRGILRRRRVAVPPLPRGSILTSVAAIPAMNSGGPGSGCRGDNCGRHSTGSRPGDRLLKQAGFHKPMAVKTKEITDEVPSIVKETQRYRSHQPKGIKALDPTEIRENWQEIKQATEMRNFARATAGILKLTREASDWLEHPKTLIDWGGRVAAAVWAVKHLAHTVLGTGGAAVHHFVVAAAPHVGVIVSHLMNLASAGIMGAEEEEFVLKVPK